MVTDVLIDGCFEARAVTLRRQEQSEGLVVIGSLSLWDHSKSWTKKVTAQEMKFKVYVFGDGSSCITECQFLFLYSLFAFSEVLSTSRGFSTFPSYSLNT